MSGKSPMSESQEPKPSKADSKIIGALLRIVEELDNRIEDVRRQLVDAELGEALSAVNEFREIMNDLRALVAKDVDYFNIRVSVWEGRSGLKASAAVLGHALEFKVEDLDPSTPVSKIIDAVLSNEENIYYAASRAFAALSDFAYKVAKIGDVRQKIDSIEKEVKWLNKTLNEIRSVCEEE